MQKKYFYPFIEGFTFCAGWKAKIDVEKILVSNGYLPLVKSCVPIIRFVSKILSNFKIKKNTILVVQYPYVELKHLNFKKTINKTKNSICIVHDILSLQEFGRVLKKEIEFFKIFKVIIVHTDAMRLLFNEYGYNGQIIVLQIFDYLTKNKVISNNFSDFNNKISIVGNLSNTPYINLLDKIVNINNNKICFEVYGEYSNNIIFKNNIVYKGCFHPDTIDNRLAGSYGLIWYGNNLDLCDGKMNEYLKYISPHKLSCYIACGIPVIVSKHSEIAKFVIQNQIGIVIDSLREIDVDYLNKVYKNHQINVLKIKDNVINGAYLTSALRKAENKCIK